MKLPSGDPFSVEWQWPSNVSHTIIKTLDEAGAHKPYFTTGDVEKALRPHIDELIGALAIIKKVWDQNEKALLFDAEARATWELCRRVLKKWGVD